MMIKVAPSILSDDFAYLADEIKKIEAAGANVLVAGSYVYGAEDTAAAIASLK